MQIITWDENEKVKSLEDQALVNHLENLLNDSTYDPDTISTKDALVYCKMKLMGEHHAILVKKMEELLMNSEIYLLTWDGEASDGGEMFRLTSYEIEDMANGTLFMEFEE
ncbi:hypothetical protein DS745_20650 [Anaerobacillus alkaliphilus]|uniref:Uncharacterized protein n=1 Tax=Anaerobacillus alkaliphilus TaxID=1548597 RepID=A0A4Q0VMG1_9BACI|nr:hypothetical protein [Anaerobacillus alkaliphilus]RXI96156.1 hypothetical protein DS745_20650 [Anaerobacillus alkaliphilus]